MKLTRFNTLYNKILFENNITNISYNTFKYKFDTDTTNNKIYCNFDSIDKSDNKLIKIKATIFQNNSYEFEITKNGKKQTYTDKEFLLAYYKEYQDFKKALSLYKKEQKQKDINKTEENKTIIDGKEITNIKNFNDVLSQINDNSDGILIKVDGMSFIIKKVDDDKYKNLVTISFSFNNDNSLQSKTELQSYDAIALAKISEKNIMILNINLYDPDNLKEATPVAKITESQFKDIFLTTYFKLKKAMQQYLTQFLIDKKF